MPEYQLYQMNKDLNEQIIQLSMHRFNDSGNESENSSNWSMSSRSIVDSDYIRTNAKMILEELDSNMLLNKQRLVINAAGLVNGARNANDGFAFFGNALKNVSNCVLLITLYK